MHQQTTRFAKRTQWSLAPNRISGLLEKLREAHQEIIDLTESNPTHCGFDYPTNRILESLAKKENLDYLPSAQGMKTAREAVCAYYAKKNFSVDPDQIFLTASTSESYSFLFRLLANPGENILFPRPSYPLFEFLVDLNDLVSSTYPLTYDRQWKIEVPKMSLALSDETKAIVLVNPNNPTGSFVKTKELEAINALCRQKDLALISDEVFFDYPFQKNSEAVSLINNTQTLTFVLGGLSKALALPQMKLSWIVVSGPKGQTEEVGKRLELIADTYLSVNTPTQNALSDWFVFLPEIQDQILKRIQHNRALLKKFFQDELLEADGGWYMVIRFPGVVGEEDFVYELLEKDHVFVHPGYFFDFEEEFHLVICLLQKPEIFEAGLIKISERIRKWK